MGRSHKAHLEIAMAISRNPRGGVATGLQKEGTFRVFREIVRNEIVRAGESLNLLPKMLGQLRELPLPRGPDSHEDRGTVHGVFPGAAMHL